MDFQELEDRLEKLPKKSAAFAAAQQLAAKTWNLQELERVLPAGSLLVHFSMDSAPNCVASVDPDITCGQLDESFRHSIIMGFLSGVWRSARLQMRDKGDPDTKISTLPRDKEGNLVICLDVLALDQPASHPQGKEPVEKERRPPLPAPSGHARPQPQKGMKRKRGGVLRPIKPGSDRAEGEPPLKRRLRFIAELGDKNQQHHYETKDSPDWDARSSLFQLVAARVGKGSLSRRLRNPRWHAMLREAADSKTCSIEGQCALQCMVGDRYVEAYEEWVTWNKSKKEEKYYTAAFRNTQGWLLETLMRSGGPPRLPPCTVPRFRWLEWTSWSDATMGEEAPARASRWVFVSPRAPNVLVHGQWPHRVSICVRSRLNGQWIEKAAISSYGGGNRLVFELHAFDPWPFGCPLPRPTCGGRRSQAKYKIGTDHRLSLWNTAEGDKEFGRSDVGAHSARRIVLELARWCYWVSMGEHPAYPWPPEIPHRHFVNHDNRVMTEKRWHRAALDYVKNPPRTLEEL